VAVDVVDLAEVVEVGEHERERLAGGAALGKPAVEEARVADAGEEVLERTGADFAEELAVPARVPAE
jgi:hypothetical protein